MSNLNYATQALIKIDESKCITCQIYKEGNNISDADETWQYYGCPRCSCENDKAIT